MLQNTSGRLLHTLLTTPSTEVVDPNQEQIDSGSEKAHTRQIIPNPVNTANPASHGDPNIHMLKRLEEK